MGTLEIAKELRRLAPDMHFEHAVNGEYFRRRSLGDLCKHFKVEPEEMIKAMVEAGMTGFYCPDIHKIVFYFLSIENLRKGFKTAKEDINYAGKYPVDVISSLYEKYYTAKSNRSDFKK